ncbi:methyl-accepting chemotaxis protein [Desulfobacterota bacterium M19]
MAKKNMTVGKQISMGFSALLIIFLVVAVVTPRDINLIIKNAKKIIQSNRLDARLAEIEIEHLNWVTKLDSYLTDPTITTLNIETDDHKCAFGKWLYGPGRRQAEHFEPSLAPLFSKIEIAHAALHKTAIAIAAAGSDAAGKEQGMKIFRQQTIPALHNVQNLLHEIRDEAKNNIISDVIMLKSAASTRTTLISLIVIAILLGIVIAFFISRRITLVLKGLAGELDESAYSLSSSSGEISASSQTLADGASQQASAVEEISASMEEISAMTKRDAENSAQSNSLMRQTNKVIHEAEQAMKNVISSMDKINSASNETQKIIKTIDEIAFQTNLLALNAAVEAARAGEAGAGFAVVAEEVRSLAMRSAEAAKNTASLIAATVEHVKTGSKLVQDTNEYFVKANESASKIGILLEENSSSANEQAQAIEQATVGLTEIDNVTQRNAASSEEEAAAAMELNNQVDAMRQIVARLAALVGSEARSFETHGTYKAAGTADKSPARPLSQSRVKALPAAKPAASPAHKSKSAVKAATPDDIIPMDDNDDFEDF